MKVRPSSVSPNSKMLQMEGMFQRGGRLGFVHEPGLGVGFGGQVRRQEFQGDGAVQRRVFGLVDHTHSAGAQFGT